MDANPIESRIGLLFVGRAIGTRISRAYIECAMDTLRGLWEFIWQGYNLPFTISLIVCVFLCSLQFLGLAGDDDTNGDLDQDGDIDGHTDGDNDSDGDDFGPFTALLDFIGLGRVPLTVFLLVFTAIFGLTGWITTRYVFGAFAPNTLLTLGMWGGVFLCSGAVTGRVARLLATILPGTTTTAIPRDELVGRVAKVVSPLVDAHYGQVKVRDAAGTLLTLFAITPDNAAPIARESEVILVDFDPQRRVFTVVPLEKNLLED